MQMVTSYTKLPTPGGTDCEIHQNYNHHPGQNFQGTKIQFIKETANQLKTTIKNNVIPNIRNQMQSDNCIEYSLVLDIQRNIGLNERRKLLKKLQLIHDVNYTHTVKQDSLLRDYSDFKVSITYKAKIRCTEDELINKLKNQWPTINQILPLYQEDKLKVNLNLVNQLLSKYTVNHPNLSSIVKVLLAASPLTGSLEQSYSKLDKICHKDCNTTATILKHCVS